MQHCGVAVTVLSCSLSITGSETAARPPGCLSCLAATQSGQECTAKTVAVPPPMALSSAGPSEGGAADRAGRNHLDPS